MQGGRQAGRTPAAPRRDEPPAAVAFGHPEPVPAAGRCSPGVLTRPHWSSLGAASPHPSLRALRSSDRPPRPRSSASSSWARPAATHPHAAPPAPTAALAFPPVGAASGPPHLSVTGGTPGRGLPWHPEHDKMSLSRGGAEFSRTRRGPWQILDREEAPGASGPGRAWPRGQARVWRPVKAVGAAL